MTDTYSHVCGFGFWICSVFSLDKKLVTKVFQVSLKTDFAKVILLKCVL